MSNKQHHTSDLPRPTIARSSNRADMIAAAEERAAFWKYPADGPWTVYVTLGKKDIPVYKSGPDEYQIGKTDKTE